MSESNDIGANLADVAARHGVRPVLLSKWRKQLPGSSTAMKKPSKFAAVKIAAALMSEGVIEIDLSTSCVRIRGVVDAAMLREVLAATR